MCVEARSGNGRMKVAAGPLARASRRVDLLGDPEMICGAR
jgi:hypothetical protein